MKQSALFILLFFKIAILAQAQKFAQLSYEDKTYESTIKTVALYPQPNTPNDPVRTIYSPVLALNSSRPLIAEFDDLRGRFRQFRFKIFHCNADWTPSSLNDIEFTYEYNDYPINDYEASFNTKIAYYQYRFMIPKLKLAGNYVVAVYEDTRPAKLVLTRRFMVYDSRITISPVVRMSAGIAEQSTHQQIDFDIDYKGYSDVLSPQDDFKVVVRQNYQWDKVLTKLRPTNVKIFDSRIEYRPFDLSNNMLGGNEFRWFDTRLSRGVSFNIDDIQQKPEQTTAYLRTDTPRSSKGAYFQAQDFNGQYIVLNTDTQSSTNEADYINVVFRLKIPQLTDGKVYVNGGFDLWQRNEANLMTYNTDSELYEAGILIKQGIVNYNYIFVGNDGKTSQNFVEGNFATTSNDYEIFVYHKPPAARTEILIGYRLIEFGRR